MTARRSSGRGPATDWKHPRRRGELAKAIGAGVGVVAATALIIFLIQPGDTTTTQTPTQTPVQTAPTGATGATPSGATGSPTGATGATGATGSSTPADTTPSTAPAASSTTPAQP